MSVSQAVPPDADPKAQAEGSPEGPGAERPATEAEKPQPDARSWRELVEAGRYSTARNAYLVSGEQDPAVRASLAALVDVLELLRERSYGRAIERLERLEERADFAPWPRIEQELLTLRDAAGALDQREAEEARELLVQIEGSWFGSEVLTQLGTSYVFDGEYDEAAQLFERAMEVDPQHYRALTNLGNVALEQERIDDAIELYQRALKVDENFPNAHHNLGVAYRKKGQLGKSVRSLRRAQRTQQRHDVAEARENIGKWAGPRFGRYFKWIIWGLMIVGGYFILRMAGFI